jgi:hypothetical protein
MNPICATVLSLACMGTTPPVEGPLGLTPHVVGRFGVIAERDGAGNTRTEPYAAMRLGVTWRHQLDNGARVAVTFELEGSSLPGLHPFRP